MTIADAQRAGAGAFIRTWRAFRRWRRARPFWGGLLAVLAGLEIFGTTQMSLGGLTFQMGPTGFLSWLIPTILAACGLLIWFTPQQRMFYAVVAAMTAVFSLIAVNLGGFLIGMVLGMVGGALGFAWTPVPVTPAPVEPVPDPDVPESAAPSVQDGPDGTAPHHTGESVGLDLLNDTLPQPRNPLRETDMSRGADEPVQQAGLGGPARPAGAREDRSVPADGPGFSTRGNPGPSLLAVLLATGLAVSGAVVLDRAEPARAAPCPSTIRPQPAPTGARTPTAPTPSLTGTSTPSSIPTASAGDSPEGSVLTDIVDGVRDLLGLEPDETTSPSATASPDAPSTSPSLPAPSGEPTAPRTAQPTPTSGQTGPAGGRCVPGRSATPHSGESADDPVPKVAAAADTPVAANAPSRLTGSTLTMTELKYEGIVEDFPTQAGPVRVLKFSMRRAVTTDFALQIQGQPGRSLRYESRQLTVDGDVAFYSTRFVGRILGIKLTLTPDSPLPPDGIDLSLPVPITFTDADIQLVLIGCDTLSVDPQLTQMIV